MTPTADLQGVLARAANHLRPINLHVVIAVNGPAPLHVFGRPAGHPVDVSVYVRPEDLDHFLAALGPLLRTLPVWTASMQARHPLAVDWSWGYQEARRAVLPRGGVFVPATRVDVLGLARDPEASVTRARMAGARAFLQQLRPAAQPQALPNAAD